jgi:hypothetical protein
VKIILAATETTLADAWEKAIRGMDGISVHRGSIFEVKYDALVSRANSFGFMDGGIDALYSDRFGWDLQNRLRRLILDRHLFHHFLELTIADRIRHIPADRPWDNVPFELATLKLDHHTLATETVARGVRQAGRCAKSRQNPLPCPPIKPAANIATGAPLGCGEYLRRIASVVA